MKKVLGIFVLVSTALVFFCCKGNGGGSSSSGSTNSGTAPATVATFASNFQNKYAI